MTDYVENQKYRRQLAQRIKDKSDCREIFRFFWPEHYREHGNSLCPFHDDLNPSLGIYKDHVYCYAKGKSWDAISLYAEGSKMSNGEAIDAMASDYNVDGSPPIKVESREKNEKQKYFDDEFRELLDRDIPEAATHYLRSRGLKQSLKLLRGRIAFSLARDRINLTRKDALCFPIAELDGRICSLQFVPLDRSNKMLARGAKTRRGFFILPGSGPLIIVEAIIDALSIKEVIPDAHVVSILSSSATSKLSLLQELSEPPILFLDGIKQELLEQTRR